MQQLVSQVLLPVVLAAIMLGMGLGLTTGDFKRIATQPKASLIGLILQVLFLPLLAIALIKALPLSPTAAAGLFLVSLCPGGATSNLFSYLARGDVALSVSLTAVVSVLSPLLLPLIFLGYLQVNGSHMAHFALPVLPAIKQLALVTLVPVGIGMIIRHMAPDWSKQAQPAIKILSTCAMILIVVALMATNLHVMQGLLTINALAVLLLTSISMAAAYFVAGVAAVNKPAQRTICIEVGVQNAGTAMMVALAIMHQPDLAFVPLMYGLLMNIPAFAFVGWVQRNHRDTSSEQTAGKSA